MYFLTLFFPENDFKSIFITFQNLVENMAQLLCSLQECLVLHFYGTVFILFILLIVCIGFLWLIDHYLIKLIYHNSMMSHTKPIFAPSMAEIVTEVKRNGSFVINMFDMFERDSEHNRCSQSNSWIYDPSSLWGRSVFKLYGEFVNQRLNQDYHE